jgi:HemY protein
MLRLFFWFIALLAGAIGLAIVARFNPGNVVLFYPPYRVDLSLNLFLLLAASLFVLLYMIVRTFRNMMRMPTKVAAYRLRKRELEANKALRDGLKALFEGRFGHAEKSSQKAAELPANAPLAALIGSRAAHSMGQRERRDQWLARLESEPPFRSARLMTMIELLVDDHRADAALDAVRELNQSGVRHIHALHWALKANQQAKNWKEVLRLVKILDKRHALHPVLAVRLRELAYEDLLGDISLDSDALLKQWQSVAPEDKLRPFVVLRAARAFNQRGMHEDAIKILERVLAQQWDERLVRAYRESAAGEGTPVLLSQIENCEAWLTQYPTDAELTLTLGVLCLRQKLWGKAQRYLEQTLADASDADKVRDAHLKLAQMHEALQQDERAAYHYRQCALANLL